MSLISKITIGFIIALIITVLLLFNVVESQKKSLRVLNNNEVYYKNKYTEYSLSNGQNVLKASQLIMSINELKHSKDSLDSVLVSTIKLMKIKEKKIMSLQHYISNTVTVNSGILRDSIIINPIDSIRIKKDSIKTAYLKSEWVDNYISYNSYNDSIYVTTYSRDELIIVAHRKMETIDPPKKFFLLRWFQKKQEIIYFDITNRNPNCKIKYSKIINTPR